MMHFKIFLLFILLGIIPSCSLFEEKEDDCIDESIDKSKISGTLLPDYYNPVCGCNERSYPGPKEAAVSVTKWEMGYCPEDSIRFGLK